MSYKQLLTFGSIAKDELMEYPGRFQDNIDPENLDKLNVFFLVQNLKIVLGGIATNISYSFSLLSSKPNYILGGIGPDGQELKNFFLKNNIRTDFLKESKELYSGSFKGLASNDQNQIGFFYYGANLEAKNINLKEIPNLSESLLIIGASHPEATKSVQNQAIELGLDYVYDPGMMLTWIDSELLKAGVNNCQYLIANEYEIQQILARIDQTLEELIQSGKKVIITKGKEGLVYRDKDQEISLPSFPIKNFVDPTGAGDAFRGGFLAGILEEKSLIDSLVQGSVMGSLAVENFGGVGHILDQKTLESRTSYLKVKILTKKYSK